MTRLLALALLLSSFLSAEVVSRSETISGTTLRYKVILPDNYDPSREYPAILAFPGGGQTIQIVDSMIARSLRAQAEKRGYIVAIASAPAEGLFFQGGDRVFPAFLEKLLADYKIRDRKFHAAGISNGGISAFHIAASYPQFFLSVTGLPGYLPEATPARLAALDGKCVHMYVGETDTGWLQAMRDQSAVFRRRGIQVTFDVEAGQGHVMRTLENAGAASLFDNFDAAQNGCPASGSSK
jgi:predicted peptidase